MAVLGLQARHLLALAVEVGSGVLQRCGRCLCLHAKLHIAVVDNDIGYKAAYQQAQQ